MKKVLVVISFLAADMPAQAQTKLYSITVTAESFRQGMTLGILPLEKTKEKYFKKIASKTAVFKVPAGKYAVSLSQTEQSEKANKFADYTAKQITVRGDMKISIAPKYLPEIPIADFNTIDEFLVSLSAIRATCDKPAVNAMCARTSMSFELINPMTKLTDGIEQRRPWTTYYDTGYLGFFTVNGNNYTLIVDRRQNSNFLIWQRN